MTPHIESKEGDIAKTVLMPGDPLRAKHIADHYLKDVRLVNNVRCMYAYTGFYKGKRITVMASGMGMPSMGIYSYELYKFYDVENIIRIGSAGSFSKDINLYDLILVDESYTTSSFAKVQGYNSDVIKSSTFLNDKIKECAINQNKKIREGKNFSTDVFYSDSDIEDLFLNKKCLCTEMESFALFYNAYQLNKKAACILTISDNLVTKQETTPMERQVAFDDMIELALETAISL